MISGVRSPATEPLRLPALHPAGGLACGRITSRTVGGPGFGCFPARHDSAGWQQKAPLT
jgi:hypothetical protein